MPDDYISSDATFCQCRAYRYSLGRRWKDGGRIAMFIGLNPSTADGTQDDPTIRRCRRFATDWGYNALWMGNLFAFRATKPADMLAHPEPTGPANDEFLRWMSTTAGIIVAAWGAHGGHRDRDQEVRKMFPDIHHLGLTKGGQPRHPLYLRADTKPTRWED